MDDPNHLNQVDSMQLTSLPVMVLMAPGVATFPVTALVSTSTAWPIMESFWAKYRIWIWYNRVNQYVSDNAA